MTKYSSKSYELRDIYSVRRTTWNIATKKGKLTISKSSRISLILDETKPLEIDRCKSKKGPQYLKYKLY